MFDQYVITLTLTISINTNCDMISICITVQIEIFSIKAKYENCYQCYIQKGQNVDKKNKKHSHDIYVSGGYHHHKH